MDQSVGQRVLARSGAVEELRARSCDLAAIERVLEEAWLDGLRFNVGRLRRDRFNNAMGEVKRGLRKLRKVLPQDSVQRMLEYAIGVLFRKYYLSPAELPGGRVTVGPIDPPTRGNQAEPWKGRAVTKLKLMRVPTDIAWELIREVGRVAETESPHLS